MDIINDEAVKRRPVQRGIRSIRGDWSARTRLVVLGNGLLPTKKERLWACEERDGEAGLYLQVP